MFSLLREPSKTRIFLAVSSWGRTAGASDPRPAAWQKVCFERRITSMISAFTTTFAKKHAATVALLCGIVVSVTPTMANVAMTDVPSVAKRGCTTATTPKWLIQISQIAFRDAANIVRERTELRVVRVMHVERYGDVYYVTVSTSSSHERERYCVRATDGAFLGRC